MRLIPRFLGAGFALAMAGCVTINIYFPSAAVARAVDKFIDEVWQIKQVQPGQTDTKSEKAGADAPASSTKQ